MEQQVQDPIAARRLLQPLGDLGADTWQALQRREQRGQARILTSLLGHATSTTGPASG
ncbi:hypothetical protein [Paracraurococcus ruber]|uniref:hypothetical protein n=1 Tax=Paracraurococcus ruber TaxID=77675 RepID=UPI001A918600|nr:hypothetical protein [Paracraurococcus ruber]